MTTADATPVSLHDGRQEIDGRPAWIRLAAAVLMSTLGGVGMWSVVVSIPAIQADLGITRGEASVPYTLIMVGFAFGGVLMGRLADRYGMMVPAVLGGCSLGAGYLLSSVAPGLWSFAIVNGVLIGMLGSSASFAPLIADVSHWFDKHRGKAVAICASGNYLAGTFWPPIVRILVDTYGWRATQAGIGLFLLATMLPLALAFRRRSPRQTAQQAAAPVRALKTLGLPPNVTIILICIAGVACCVAMSMPQVHIVAYCGDLGYGVARGAEMLSLMLAFGIISRIATGFVADKIGGLMTLLIGSTLQGVALFLYLLFDGLTSLYIISILFGLFQGGIVPSYAIIIREYFPAQRAATLVGLAIMSTLFGMALGGWISGVIFDMTGSYRLAFLNGLMWNLVNVAIVVWLLLMAQRRTATARG